MNQGSNTNAAPKKPTRKQLEEVVRAMSERIVSDSRTIVHHENERRNAENICFQLQAERNAAQRENAALNGNLNELENTRVIAAQGLQIERDELLVRVAKLNMRIRGLGFQA